MRLWVVGQYKSGMLPGVVWDFQGIYSTREKAVRACRNQYYCIFPVKLDEELPDETISPPELEFPLLEEENKANV